MIKFIRIQNPVGLEYVKQHLILGEAASDLDDLVELLKGILVNQPTRTYYQAVVEDETILAFVLAYISSNASYATVFQVWKNPDYTGSQSVIETMFMRFLLWCEQNEVVEVRMDDVRNDTNLQTQWGFETCMTVRSLNVTSALENKLSTSKAVSPNEGVI